MAEPRPPQLSNGSADASPVTTGQVVGTTSGGGPFCAIFAAAGTHTVEAQYKVDGAATAGVKNRKLWVWTLGF